MARKPRDYKKEYADFHGKPQQRKNRSQRTTDRNKAVRKGTVSRGDGKEIDHVKPLSKSPVRGKAKAGSRKTRIVSRSTNRKKGKKG